MSVIVNVLGTAQDGGIPQPNCACSNCQEAYRNHKKKRNAASLALVLPELEKWYLIDATPDFKEQVIHLQQKYPSLGKMDGIFLTHAHIGHYTGLMFLGREAMSTKVMPVFASDQMKCMLESNVPWSQLVNLHNVSLKPLQAGNPVMIENEISIEPVEVPHRNEFAETFGFIISGPHKKLLYIPDIDAWDDWDLDIAKIASRVDYCLLDATFSSREEVSSLLGRDPEEIPHPYITETMDVLQGVVDPGGTEVYFTHFNHSNRVLEEESVEYKKVIERGFHLADDGMEFKL